MAVRIALLRAVNLAGHGRIAMADLKALCEGLGLAKVTTLLNSGNVVFDDPQARSPAALEELLESETEKQLGLKTDFMLRSPEEWSAVIAANPFPEMAANDPSHLLVVFLNGPAPPPDAIARVNAAIAGPEKIAGNSRELYITYPDGIGTSKLSNSVIEKALRQNRGTGRNWNTVLKLAAAAARIGS